MDIEYIAALIFSFLVIMVVGGVILLFPVTRRLGKLLERRLAEDRGASDVDAEVASLRHAVGSLDERLRHVSDRQTFMEELLEERRRAALPEGGLPDDEDRRALDDPT